MTFEEYLAEANLIHARHPEWRLGQTYYSLLTTCRRDLSKRVVDANLDPFYTMGNALGPFLTWVADNW